MKKEETKIDEENLVESRDWMRIIESKFGLFFNVVFALIGGYAVIEMARNMDLIKVLSIPNMIIYVTVTFVLVQWTFHNIDEVRRKW